MKRVLVVTHIRSLWSKNKTGSSYAINSLLDYLSNSCDVTVYCTKYVAKRPLTNKFKVYSSESGVIFLLNALLLRIVSLFGFSVPKRIFQDSSSLSSKIELMLFERYIKYKKYDLIIFEYIHTAHLCTKHVRDNYLCAIDTHDVMHHRFSDFEAIGKKTTYTQSITKDEELDILDNFSYVFAIQEEDYSYLQSYLGDKVILVKRPAKIVRLHKKNDQVSDKLKVVFVGSSADHNVDAINWFVSDIWCDDLAKQVDFFVYGAVCDKLLIKPDNINFIGQIDNVSDAYLDCDLVVNPVRISSGLKIKNLEALGFGCPVLTTPEGALGMEFCVGSSMVVASNASHFNLELHALAENRSRVRCLSSNAIRDAESHFGIGSCFQSLDRIICEL